MLLLELKMIFCTYDNELTFQLVKMCGVRETVERWSMGSWCLVSVSADLLCIQSCCCRGNPELRYLCPDLVSAWGVLSVQWWLTNGCVACAQVSVPLSAVFSNSEEHTYMHGLLPKASLHWGRWYLKVIRALKNTPGIKKNILGDKFPYAG